MESHLDQLRRWTVVVADTGDIDALAAHAPRDATTNPTLILKAAQMPAHAALVARTLERIPAAARTRVEHCETATEHLLVAFGCAILAVIPGRVSTETPARASFDVEAILASARRLVALYAEAGIGRERVLIKIAATWEGIRAAERLEAEGIHCNLTLVFSLVQAAACAEAGVTLISPFVGRILDWYRARTGREYPPEEDPGVASVRTIHRYLKQRGHRTEVMGASFRSRAQVEALAGCDLLTVSPALLAELASAEGALTRRLDPDEARTSEPLPRVAVDESSFRWQLNEDAMATEKLSEGIRIFDADARALHALLAREAAREAG